MVPVQVLGELFRVLVGKGGRSRAAARASITSWRDAFATRATTEATMLAAIDLAADHDLSIWDAVILAAAADAGCRLVLSEDMQDGFAWRGLTVDNPFVDPRHPLLAAIARTSKESSYLPELGDCGDCRGEMALSRQLPGQGRRTGRR